MRITLEFPTRGGRVALLALLISLPVWVYAWRPAWLASTPVCGFRLLAGHPCPLCGMTTSLRRLTEGRVRAAWCAHRAGPVVLVYGGLRVLVFVGSRRSERGRHWDRRLRSRPVAGCLIAFILVAWLIRLFHP